MKTEFEAIQATPVGPDRLVLRLHGGYFPFKERVRDVVVDPALTTPYSVPLYELFGLDSRTALRGYRGSERGTNEDHLTAEYAIPIVADAGKRSSASIGATSTASDTRERATWATTCAPTPP